MNKIKLIIVEDHTLTRIGLKTAFEESQTLEVIGEAEDAETGIPLILELKPDIVLMDLGLPGINGIEATKKIKQENEEIKIIILTSHERDTEVIGAITSGANAYCLKDISPIKLISIIENIANGGIWIDQNVAKTVLGKLITNEKEKSTSNQGLKSPLTEREIEILQHLADGLSNPEIADKLLVSQYTIKSHISNILQKLSVDDRTQAVVRGIRNGWIT